MRRRKPLRHGVLPSLLIAVALMTGCHPAMTTQTQAMQYHAIQPPPETHAVPLRFGRHNFATHCYNTIGCQVIYAGRYQQEDGPEDVTPPPPKDLKKAWNSVELGIENFPPPAEVRWKSLDGAQHEAKLDMASIFKDELIWHKVPKADMADFFHGPVAGEPDIFLEVNDHIINVYMKMLIPTRTEQIPGNKYSYGRDDLFLILTHTY